MDGEGDSGNYTGVYLAAQSWRYAQAKTRARAKLGVDPLDTRPAARRRCSSGASSATRRAPEADEMVRYFHVLVNIADAVADRARPEGHRQRAQLRRGRLDRLRRRGRPGGAGLLMRTCTPTDARRSAGRPAPQPRRAPQPLRPVHVGGRATTGTASAGRAATPTPARSSGSPSRSTSSATDENRELRTMLAARPHGDDRLRGQVPVVPAAPARDGRQPGVRPQRPRRPDQPAVHPGRAAPAAPAADRAPRRRGHRRRRGEGRATTCCGKRRSPPRFATGALLDVDAHRRRRAAQRATTSTSST